jgi:3-phenylpropionate/trans-cinnamate dioxygenase ferredoxin reductase subunit
MAGLSRSHDSHAIRGSVESGKFSIFYFTGNKLCAVDSVNRPGDHMLARRLLNARAKVCAAQVRDISFDLSAVLKE